MVKFDEAQVRKRLLETDFPEVVIDLELTAVGNMHEDLQDVFDAWLQGVEKEFTFRGVTLAMIKEKRRCGHLAAMSTMSFFIKEPDRIKEFFAIPDIIAQRRCLGIR